MPLEGIEEAIPQADERLSNEAALAALSALRIKIRNEEGKEIEVTPRWMELYKRLVEGGWKWRVAVYIAWASQPKKYRWPDTQEELATKCLGLNSDRAIATWRKKNPAVDETISMLQGSIIFDALPDAFGAMVEVATTADYKGHQDRKLMFEMSGAYTPSSKITAEMVKRLGKGNMDASDLSDEDLREIASAAGSELERRTHDPAQDEEEKPE
jgi:hypothetical protein